MIQRREIVFCPKCGAENLSQQRYCRQCGMLTPSDPDFIFDRRIVQEFTRLREGDCQLGKLVLILRNVHNSLTLSLAFLILLLVELVARGQVHITLFLLVGALMVSGWQFRRFLKLFHKFMDTPRASSELKRSAVGDSGELPASSPLSDNLRWQQTAPILASQRTTQRLTNPRNRFRIPAAGFSKSSPEPRVS